MNEPKLRTGEWWKTATVGKKHDGRVKYALEQQDQIKELHAQGISERATARTVGCSRAYVSYTTNPARRASIQARIASTWKQNYNRKKHTRAQRKTRRKIKGLNPKPKQPTAPTYQQIARARKSPPLKSN